MKKYVIELNENKYKKMKKYIEQSGCSDYYDNAIAKAIPLEEEFEKLKEEMEVIHDRYKINFQGYSMSVAKECIEVIDNHIKELKGENKHIDVSVDPYDMKYIRCEKGDNNG